MLSASHRSLKGMIDETRSLRLAARRHAFLFFHVDRHLFISVITFEALASPCTVLESPEGLSAVILGDGSDYKASCNRVDGTVPKTRVYEHGQRQHKQ